MVLLTKNEDFLIYGSDNLNLADELLKALSLKKQEFLKLFRMTFLPTIEINLYETRDEYYSKFENFNDGNDLKINLCYQGVVKNQLLKYILHEYLYKLLQYCTKDEIPLWLKEGITIILNEERLKSDKSKMAFKAFYLDKIVRRDKEIPNSSFFKVKNKREFKILRNNYSWEDISYLLVHYLIEKYATIYEVINNIDKIKLSETLIEECISYYNHKYQVNNNFYEIKTDSELMDYMNKNIIYGWLDKDKNQYIDTLRNFREKYRTASIEEILESNIGTCIEQAKLAKYWFDLHGIENKMFCYRNYEEDNVKDDVKMHCFIIFHYQNYWYHFEHSAIRKRGIHRYNNLDDALDSIRDFFRDRCLTELTEIPDIPNGLTYQEFNEYVNTFHSYEETRGR